MFQKGEIMLKTFTERFGDWKLALLEHLQLSLLSLIIAMLISIPLGIILVK